MEAIVYNNSEEFNEHQLQERIKEQMPGYIIQTWDLDEYQTAGIFGSVIEELKYPLEQGKQIEDIQYVEEWCTDSCDAYFSILAYKTQSTKETSDLELNCNSVIVGNNENKKTFDLVKLLSAIDKLADNFTE